MTNKLGVLINKLLTTSLGRGSLIMVGGSFVVGGVSFIFNPIMGIMLGPAGYGELLSLLSLLIIFSVPALTLNTILIKTTASLQAKNELENVKFLYNWITKRFFYGSLLIILLFWLFSGELAGFLNVNQTFPIFLLGVLVVATFFFTINGALLQGLLKFENYTFANLLNAILRVLIAVLLVGFGFNVNGALGGLVLAIILAYILGWFFLNKVFQNVAIKRTNIRELSHFIGPAFIATLGLTLMNNLDIVLVKHFFSPIEAGYYGAGVITSRVIVFASLPITQVIFPLVTQRAESKKAYHHLLEIGLFLTFAIGAVTALVYFLLPNMVLKIFFFSSSSQYLGALGIIGIFSVVITIYSINTLLTYFFLSLHKVRFSFAPFLAGIIEGLLIWFYHPSLLGVIGVAMGVNIILALGLLSYYFIGKQKHD